MFYLLRCLIWSILSTSKTGLQAAATVLNKPRICCRSAKCLKLPPMSFAATGRQRQAVTKRSLKRKPKKLLNLSPKSKCRSPKPTQPKKLRSPQNQSHSQAVKLHQLHQPHQPRSGLTMNRRIVGITDAGGCNQYQSRKFRLFRFPVRTVMNRSQHPKTDAVLGCRQTH